MTKFNLYPAAEIAAHIDSPSNINKDIKEAAKEIKYVLDNAGSSDTLTVTTETETTTLTWKNSVFMPGSIPEEIETLIGKDNPLNNKIEAMKKIKRIYFNETNPNSVLSDTEDLRETVDKEFLESIGYSYKRAFHNMQDTVLDFSCILKAIKCEQAKESTTKKLTMMIPDGSANFRKILNSMTYAGIITGYRRYTNWLYSYFVIDFNSKNCTAEK